MNLEEKLRRIKKVFDIAKVRSIKTDQEAINKYYKINSLSYSFFHDPSYIHIGITRNGSYQKDDLV